MSDEEEAQHKPLTPNQKKTAEEYLWYREWLLTQDYEMEEVDGPSV